MIDIYEKSNNFQNFAMILFFILKGQDTVITVELVGVGEGGCGNIQGQPKKSSM
jgi:hypothetical protein